MMKIDFIRVYHKQSVLSAFYTMERCHPCSIFYIFNIFFKFDQALNNKTQDQ